MATDDPSGTHGVRAIDELRRLLEQVHAAWTSGRTEDLESVFHADMVICGPGNRVFAEGRDACIASYSDFVTGATVLSYKASPPTVRVFDGTAVCTFDWSMTWRRDGDPATDSGSDQFVFARTGGRWQAVHRLVTFGGVEAAES